MHGPVPPLWRPEEVNYASFAELVGLSEELPTYLPWPMSPGWSIADFGCVAERGRTSATVTTTVGTSDLDGPVEVTVISEEPGVGLGARCAGTAYVDPGEQIGRGPHAINVRAGGRPVRMWAVDPADDDDLLAKSVFAGEADGRWLWLVVRPASAALLLRDEWLFEDVTGFGPEALEMPFGGARPRW
ncbi:MAG: hypothetical protein NTV23_08490 [Propionibacteriales bacterium]|nr:hypothetical protein [Propionibacteriales bacterium]